MNKFKYLKRGLVIPLIIFCLSLSSIITVQARSFNEWIYTIYDENGNIIESGKTISNDDERQSWGSQTLKPNQMVVFQFSDSSDGMLDPDDVVTISYTLDRVAKHMVRISHLSTYTDYDFTLRSNTFTYKAEAPFRTGYAFALKNKSLDSIKLEYFSVILEN